MPKKTFHKLKDEKRERFIQVALEEFANHYYENASISRIVEKMGIAKGSFYQYFEDKKDLYLYLNEYCNQQKQKAMGNLFQQEFEDFTKTYAQMHQASLQFDLKHPLLSAFLANVAQERHNQELGNLQQIIRKQSMAYFQKLLTRAQAQGKLREDIPLDFLSYLLVQIGSGLRDYLLLQFGHQASDKDLEHLMQSLQVFLKEGMTPPADLEQ